MVAGQVAIRQTIIASANLVLPVCVAQTSVPAVWTVHVSLPSATSQVLAGYLADSRGRHRRCARGRHETPLAAPEAVTAASAVADVESTVTKSAVPVTATEADAPMPLTRFATFVAVTATLAAALMQAMNEAVAAIETAPVTDASTPRIRSIGSGSDSDRCRCRHCYRHLNCARCRDC